MSNIKTVNLVVFGIGKVGSVFVNQINALRQQLFEERKLYLRVPIITNSKIAFFDKEGASNSWETDFELAAVPYKINDILKYKIQHNFQNCIAIDATASSSFVAHYKELVAHGFHIVSANKIANTLSLDFYEDLRSVLEKYDKKFLYETNVGAGLPVIETVSNLRHSGDEITNIRGVFSGSLSYIFNDFSQKNVSFSKVLQKASQQGLTEPDVREDLSGNDVARKLLILSRELGFKTEIEDVKIESLVPKKLNGKTTLNQFKSRIDELNTVFESRKKRLKNNQVLRYVGELNVPNKTLEVKLIETSSTSPLGQLKGSDAFFEIYSKAYEKQPLIIQGAGAGKEVTARGLLSDVLKVSNNLN
ncbi:MAG: aspartate kinase [Flavobacteriaceae bacterium]|nr:aspartate kinase [Flavobacteriaceae bacterium]